MENPIDKIMKTRYKYAFIGFIIALIVFAIGAVTIEELDSVIHEKQIGYAEFTVQDKHINQDDKQYYIIESDENETFDISNDEEGTELFNKIEIGKHYHFVIQHQPDATTTHIIQVYNEKD